MGVLAAEVVYPDPRGGTAEKIHLLAGCVNCGYGPVGPHDRQGQSREARSGADVENGFDGDLSRTDPY